MAQNTISLEQIRIKAANLNVSATNTVTLPADYVDLLKIGIVGEDGLVYVFGENKNKNLLANNAGDLPDYLLGYSDFIYRNFVNSTTDGRLYGYGGGHYSGEYRINLGENRIELTLGTGTDTVYIEYIADEALAANPFCSRIRRAGYSCIHLLPPCGA
jgi:hypothetical protein